MPHVTAVHDDLERVRDDVRAARLSDGVFHLVLEVGSDEVVLAGVHVRHRGLREVLREFFPRVQRRPEVLAHVQAPDALALEHVGEPLELLVEEAGLGERDVRFASSARWLFLKGSASRLARWGP